MSAEKKQSEVGFVQRVFDTQIVSDKFKKREMWLNIPSEYPQTIQFQVTQGRVDLLDNIKVNDEVEVFYNIRGKVYTNKQGGESCFTSLEAWKINVLSEALIDESSNEQINTSANDLPF